jgi:hypothetical protein
MRTERQVDQKAKGSIAVSEPEECAVQRSQQGFFIVLLMSSQTRGKVHDSDNAH